MHEAAGKDDEPCRSKGRPLLKGKSVTGFSCTKVKGHKSLDHAAIGLEGKVYQTWRERKLPN